MKVVLGRNWIGEKKEKESENKDGFGKKVHQERWLQLINKFDLKAITSPWNKTWANNLFWMPHNVIFSLNFVQQRCKNFYII